MKIDAHQHFWQYNAQRDTWITPEMAFIRRDFGPANLRPLLASHGLNGCVVVQASQSETETDWLLELAAAHPFIRGVVGWVDLQAPDVAERLAHYRQFSKLKGFRHVLQGEADRALLLTPAFRRGVAALGARGFTYDLLILPDQLGYARQLAADFPDQLFVLDHLAKPPIKTQEINDWARDMRALAALPNVHCKVSGLVTEADWHAWQPADFRPCLDVVFEAFGLERVLFGSDWPVCTVAGGYGAVVGLAHEYLTAFSAAEKARFWGENAVSFYSLSA